MKAYLIQIDAWSGSTAAPVRLASHNDERLCHLDGKTWWPAIAALPTLRYDFFDGAFDAGSITSPSGDMSVAFNAIPTLPALSLHDTRIRIWRGELGDAWGGFSLMFDGRVQEQPATTEGIASLKFGVDDSWLDQPLLATYGGTGGADGPPDIQGEVKPLALGAPRFAPAVLVDAVDDIYQLSGYGAINAVEMAFERLNRFGAPTGNTANFASLKAATIAPGAWATCLSGGYVRFGAPPDGLLSFHVQGDAVGGWSRKPGDIIARIATIGGGAGKFSASDMTALNASRPWNLSVMVTAQTTARELIQRIAASVNAVAFVDWLGQLRVAPIGIGTASLTLASDGSALPPVASVEQVAVAAPYWKLAQGAAVTWQVHGLNDIAFNAPLNPRGPYDPAETYREGDMVTLPNGSQWLFVGTTPATGSTPGPGNANWYRLADDITAGNITYEDGTPVEELKPAEPGATNGASPYEKDKLAELDADTATALTNIAAAQATITSMQSDAAAMQAALTTAQGQITAQGAAILANANDIATVQSTVASQGAAITTLQQTATDLTGSIATLTTTITAFMQGSDNLLTNTDLATGSAGYASASGSGIDAITFSWDSGSALKPGGENCLLINQASATAAGWAEYRQTIAVEVGKRYELSVWAAAARCTVSVTQAFFDSAGAVIGSTGSTTYTPAGGGLSLDNYSRIFRVSGDAPAGAVTMRISLRKNATNSGSDSWARFLRPQVAETFAGAPSPRAFSHGTGKASIIQNATAISTLDGQYAALSTTVGVQGASITGLQSASSTQAGQIATIQTGLSTANANISTNSSAITGLNSSVASINSTLAAQGASITTMQSAITTLEGSTATLTTTLTASMSGTGNLLTNTSFDNGWDGWGTSSGGGITGITFGWSDSSSTGVPDGENSINIVQSTNVASGWSRFGQDFAVEAGKYYEASVWAAANRCTVAIRTWFYDAAGTNLGENGPSWAPPNGGKALDNYARYQWVRQAPAGAVKMRMAMQKNGTTSGSDSWARFLRPQVVETFAGAPSPRAFSHGSNKASIVQSFETLSTLTTQYASLSSTVSTQGVTITSQQTAITTINNNVTTLFGRWGVEIDVNGYVSGITTNNNGSRSDLIVRADRFAITSSAGAGTAYPFEVISGVTYIKTAVIQDLSIGTQKIAEFAVQRVYFATLAGALTLPNTTMTQILSATVTKSISNSVIDIIANIRFTSSDDVRGTAYLHDGTSYIDQIEVFMNGSGGTFKAPLAFSFVDTATGTGSRTYSIRFQRNGGGSTLYAAAGSNFKVTEIKR